VFSEDGHVQLFCGSCNDAISSSDNAASPGRTIYEWWLETMYKEAVVCFKTLSRNSPVGIEENYQKPLSQDSRYPNRDSNLAPTRTDLQIISQLTRSYAIKNKIFCLHVYNFMVQDYTSTTDSHLLSRWYLVRLIRPWRLRRYVPPKHKLTCCDLYGVMSQKIITFNYLAGHEILYFRETWCSLSFLQSSTLSQLHTIRFLTHPFSKILLDLIIPTSLLSSE
jgi:hypothetical protein